MKFKLVETLEESGLSRIWSHTKDSDTFAIIGSQDQDTKEDKSDELLSRLKSYMINQRANGINVGYKPLFGSYQYEDGTVGEELSLIIYNITKEKALELMRAINQESIIWKDDKFFGFLDSNGNPDGSFSNNNINMNLSDSDIKLFGSRLAKHKNKNQLQPFKFVLEQYKASEDMSAVRNMASQDRVKEKIFELDL